MNEEKKEIRVTITAPEARMGPVGMHYFGTEFHRYAKASIPKEPNAYTPLPYYLFCHSIELLLKGFLIANGWDQDRCKKKLGHDLKKSVKAAIREGLNKFYQVSDEELNAIEKANDIYRNKGFEYFLGVEFLPMMLRKKLPDLEVIEKFSESLAEAIRKPCYES